MNFCPNSRLFYPGVPDEDKLCFRKGSGRGKRRPVFHGAEQVKRACSGLVNAQTHLPAQDCAAVFFFLNKFIYFIYLFLVPLGLRCCARAFSSCGERGLLLLQCTGFSLRWLLLLQSMGSRRVGSVVVALGL